MDECLCVSCCVAGRCITTWMTVCKLLCGWTLLIVCVHIVWLDVADCLCTSCVDGRCWLFVHKLCGWTLLTVCVHVVVWLDVADCLCTRCVAGRCWPFVYKLCGWMLLIVCVHVVWLDIALQRGWLCISCCVAGRCITTWTQWFVCVCGQRHAREDVRLQGYLMKTGPGSRSKTSCSAHHLPLTTHHMHEHPHGTTL